MTPVTDMGHMNQWCQNIRSTMRNKIMYDLEDETVTPVGLGTKTHLFYAVVIDQGQLYMDLTGRFPVRSSKGNWHVMVCYSYDCNYAKPVPMKSRSSSEWLKAYDGINQELTSKGFTPKLQKLDNEASAALKIYLRKMMWSIKFFHLTVTYTTPQSAIHKLSKTHFVAGLVSADPYFSLQ
jgi:hypothetical protein